MEFRYRLIPAWPPLAWLAHCRPGDPAIEVWHGPDVVVTPDWFCEAVWDATFDEGAFDRTDVVFGSGGRRRRDVIFVASATTVDRLQSLTTSDGTTLVSNSLVCLLQVANGEPDPAYPGYFRDFSSIRFGIDRYHRLLPTSAGPVAFTYYRNLVWDGRECVTGDKPAALRDLSRFSRYRGFLDATLERLAENLTAPARPRPLQWLGTISSGYDSPAVAVLARPFGLRDVLSFERSGPTGSDSGVAIAHGLGLRPILLQRDAWRSKPDAEVPFLAADAKGEDVFFAAATPQLTGRALLTGFHGDKMWDKYTRALGPDVVRGDQSGLSLTEFRLTAGFLHCPVPFLGVRQIRAINRISRSAELAPWDVPGRYSRPICRRIVEEAGVPRDLFGRAKRAASVLFFESQSFLSPGALTDYQAWLTAHGLNGARSIQRRLAARVVSPLQQLADASPGETMWRVVRRVTRWAHHEPRFRWLFPWALARAKQSYERATDAAA